MELLSPFWLILKRCHCKGNSVKHNSTPFRTENLSNLLNFPPLQSHCFYLYLFDLLSLSLSPLFFPCTKLSLVSTHKGGVMGVMKLSIARDAPQIPGKMQFNDAAEWIWESAKSYLVLCQRCTQLQSSAWLSRWRWRWNVSCFSSIQGLHCCLKWICLFCDCSVDNIIISNS